MLDIFVGPLSSVDPTVCEQYMYPEQNIHTHICTHRKKLLVSSVFVCFLLKACKILNHSNSIRFTSSHFGVIRPVLGMVRFAFPCLIPNLSHTLLKFMIHLLSSFTISFKIGEISRH
uniref:Uncharacterized protein n=1 Tax=Octopus bimaculoides TaxID=37653 RepID=A0A0L8FQJ1_OCTBM